MKTYLKRLKNHPGVPLAGIFTFFFAAASWPQPWVGVLVSLVFPWSIVLFTARTQPLPFDDDEL